MKTIQILIISLASIAGFSGCATTQMPAIPDGFVAVESTFFDAVMYEPSTEVFTVRYDDGCVHRILGVSRCEYHTFMSTPGKKGYFKATLDLRPHEIVRTEAKEPRLSRVIGTRYERNGGSHTVYRGPYYEVE